MHPSESEPPFEDTSSLGIVSTYIAKFIIVCLALSFAFMFYLSIRPCKYDNICELPPFSIFLFLIASGISVLSLMGLLLAYLAPKQDTPERMFKRQQGLSWNSILFFLSIAFMLFFIFSAL